MTVAQTEIKTDGKSVTFLGKKVYHSNNKNLVSKEHLVNMRLDSISYPESNAQVIDEFLKKCDGSTFRITMERV